MIKADDVFKIGIIRSLHGVNGEVEMTFNETALDLSETTSVFLKINGLLVPFFIEDCRFKNNYTVVIQFEHTDSMEARQLCGVEVFILRSALPAPHRKGQSDWDCLIGFSVEDENESPIGMVREVLTATSNILLYVQRPDSTEVLLPLHPDLLVRCDEKERKIVMRLPDGLLTLND